MGQEILETKLLQLELDSEHLKREVIELREILIALSWTITELEKKLESAKS